jgi:hypothetical protein
MVGRHTSIRNINQILDLFLEQTTPESGFSVAQLIEHGNVRHALKEVSSFTTLLLFQIPLQGIELYLIFFGLVDSFYPGGLLGQCWPLLNRLSVVSRREKLV